MKSIMNEIKSNGNEIIRDNNFLIVAFQNRLSCRMLKIFEKNNIPFNKNIINKSIDEYLINNMVETNEDIIDKYIELLKKYEKIMQGYVTRKIDIEIIKKATSAFVEKISKKNKGNFTINMCTNFIENIKSLIFVYDNRDLNSEILSRINDDTKEIIEEINKNNFNFVIESINIIIKNIINNV